MKFDEEKKSAHIPIKRTGRPEEVAKVVCFLASDDVVQGYALGAKNLDIIPENPPEGTGICAGGKEFL